MGAVVGLVVGFGVGVGDGVGFVVGLVVGLGVGVGDGVGFGVGFVVGFVVGFGEGVGAVVGATGVSWMTLTRSWTVLENAFPLFVRVRAADDMIPVGAQVYTIPLCMATAVVNATGSSGTTNSLYNNYSNAGMFELT